MRSKWESIDRIMSLLIEERETKENDARLKGAADQKKRAIHRRWYRTPSALNRVLGARVKKEKISEFFQDRQFASPQVQRPS